jgi:hypothetical protein
MGIDGIGKSGSPPPIGGPAGGQKSDAEFRVTPAEANTDNDLARLDRSEITKEQYLQLRVEQATSHLEGRISPERMGEIKQQLLSQLEVDPVLQRLLQRTTGSAAADNEG